MQLFANDLTVFFMKYIYRVPAHHFFNFMRCFLGVLCFKAVGEYYQWLQGKQKMHGIYLYLLSCILVLELALIYKHKEDTLDHAFIDEYGKAILTVYALLFLVLLVKVALSDLYAKVYQYKSGMESSRKL